MDLKIIFVWLEICWWCELKQLSVFDVKLRRLDNSSIDSSEGFLIFVKLSVLLWLPLILSVRCECKLTLYVDILLLLPKLVLSLYTGGNVLDFWKVLGGFLGGAGYLSPTSVNVDASCVPGLGDGISLSKFKSKGLWHNFSNSSVSVSDSQPLKLNLILNIF